MRLLVFTTLYPSAAEPQRGLFVERRLRKLAESGDLSAIVVAPVPWFPFGHPRFGRFATYSRVPRVEERYGIRVHHPRYLSLPGVSQYVAAAFMYLAAGRLCRRLIRDHRAQIVDAHYLYPDAVAAALIARRNRLPLVATARGSDLNVLPENPFCRALIRFVGRQAAAIITVSESLRRRAIEIGLEASRLVTLLNGVDTATFRPMTDSGCTVRSRLGLKPGRRLLLSVGHLVENKGHQLVIEALETVPDTDLLIVGEGEHRARLEQAAAERGLADRVRFAGPVAPDILITYYNAADALVLASATEGMPNVVLEALSCGLPVVATDCGGVGEILQHRVQGAVVEQRTPQAIAEGVRTVLASAGPRDEVRRTALKLDWKEVVEKQRHLYAAVLDAPDPVAEGRA